jgi:hypothetical protein
VGHNVHVEAPHVLAELVRRIFIVQGSR